MGAAIKAYQAKYYSINRKHIVSSKKARYTTDPEYRDRVRDRAKFIKRLHAASFHYGGLPVNGGESNEYAFLLSQVAEILDIGKSTMYRLKEYLPSPLYWNEHDALYTTSQIRWIFEALATYKNARDMAVPLSLMWHISWSKELVRRFRKNVKDQESKTSR